MDEQAERQGWGQLEQGSADTCISHNQFLNVKYFHECHKCEQRDGLEEYTSCAW